MYWNLTAGALVKEFPLRGQSLGGRIIVFISGGLKPRAKATPIGGKRSRIPFFIGEKGLQDEPDREH